jgi:hypothetical protein
VAVDRSKWIMNRKPEKTNQVSLEDFCKPPRCKRCGIPLNESTMSLESSNHCKWCKKVLPLEDL